MKNYRVVLLFVISISLLLYGCGKPPSPIDMIRTALKGVSTFSIILDDMKEDGNFFKTYYHKYQNLLLLHLHFQETALLQHEV